MNKELCAAKEQEIEDARANYDQIITDLETKLKAAKLERDGKVSTLQQERDAIALKIKLQDYPARLVKKHKTCSVCGGQMRPFNITQGEELKKIWACQNGNLTDAHDLVYVDVSPNADSIRP